MARAEANWERLVRAALRGERLAGVYGQPVTGIAGNVPSSLGNNVHIEEVLRAADEIQDEDPTVARILCEHAYSLAQNLDPNSEGRGVLQFKTGLMSVIRQKLAKRDGGAIDRSQDIAKLQEFYKLYREKHKVDELIEDEMKLRESAVYKELERKTLKRKKVLATLKVLWSVIEDLTKEISPEDAKKLISEEMKKVMQKDAARTEDVVPYNIIPLDALSSTTNAIVTFPEVRAAISTLQYHRDFPRLPGTFSVPDARNSDMLDLLQCVFGFQEGNVKNQREHVVHLLANEQSRVGKPSGNEPLARELEEILRKQTAEPAESCRSNGTVSFLENVISPLYDIIAAEAANNKNGRAPHSAWRNYDDFNEFFWSLKCFHLGWPWKLENPFFSKPSKKKENNYVGRGMHESPLDYIKYVAFWIAILGAKFSFTYFLQESFSFSVSTIYNHNAITILSLWAPVVSIYLLDIHVFYTVLSAIYGFLLGARDRLGEISSVEAVHRFFEKFPGAFMDKLHVAVPKRKQLLSSGQLTELNKFDASRFAPFWNEIVRNLREEDYINNAELELLLMPKNDGVLPIVQWPLFLLASKVFVAKDMAAELKDSQEELWLRISKDEYMQFAVVEVERIYVGIRESISKKNIQRDLHFAKLHIVIAKLVAVLGILRGTTESSDLKKGAVNAIQDLYEVVREVFSVDMRARAEGRLFNNLMWPNDPGLKDLIKRLYSLLTVKESAVNVPKNLEARRRLQFFTNSLFMQMPVARPASEMFSFSVFTPYYSEIVLYSMAELLKKNEDGITTLFYLQKIYPDEWKNFLTRINRDENAADSELFGNPNDILELLRGMMYYRKALMLQSYLERTRSEDLESTFALAGSADTHFELSPEARAQADLKFTYVVTCQIYGKQKGEGKLEAADIALLMQRNEALRVAFIDEVESVKNGKPSIDYYSKLVKADIHWNDKEIYSIKLPGNPKLGEGKPENQNHAIIFTRGNAVQTIDMNQDNYFEEALKMRNLLEEFSLKRGKYYPSILGVREHVFTGSVSSLASFMSNQETSFVTLGQRILANPLKVRMHYGHPDVFDRIFHITRGGIRFNSTLRQGSITHHEYIQVGKGRDVGLNQIAVFEGKVAGGNGEQVLSRDIYRLGQLFDFFRMLSFYVSTVGFYFCTMLTVLTVYIFLYGKTYLALSGVGESIQNRADILQNTALNAALNTQFLFQIGVFTAVPMVLGFILESGVLTMIKIIVVNSLALQVYWISWAVLGGLLVLLLVFGLNPKAMVHFQLFLRLVKSIALLMVLAGLIVAIVFTKLSVTDVFASILAFVPTGWGILSIAVAWRPIVKKLGLWKTMRSLARLYDAGMGMIIFVPIAICSWFPFISTFQTRLLFNQAFSRGLEISLILAGNNPNAGM
ncbi:Callose synthase 9 [Dichanthelium oligosanthes]|uniref:1,3-beta-glucan synthase n=1 Tax=Dichanthelium oligosanthes TaxID=888268 RepID=A0A1E5VC18_9POAL|nr:Callose synthase 9 [Dichanthelium oligosanthes]